MTQCVWNLHSESFVFILISKYLSKLLVFIILSLFLHSIHFLYRMKRFIQVCNAHRNFKHKLESLFINYILVLYIFMFHYESMTCRVVKLKKIGSFVNSQLFLNPQHQNYYWKQSSVVSVVVVMMITLYV